MQCDTFLMSLRPNDEALLKLGRGNDTLRRTDWRIDGPGACAPFMGTTERCTGEGGGYFMLYNSIRS
jgi:hypothetical protein